MSDDRPMDDAPPPPVIGRKRRDQLDLFGEPTNKKPKAGDGRHLHMTAGDGRVAVPGMASFAGEGPPNKYCQDCRWFGSVLLTRPDYDTIEHASEACALWAKRMGKAAPQTRDREIRVAPACKHFEQAVEATRAFRIDPAGELTEQ